MIVTLALITVVVSGLYSLEADAQSITITDFDITDTVVEAGEKVTVTAEAAGVDIGSYVVRIKEKGKSLPGFHLFVAINYAFIAAKDVAPPHLYLLKDNGERDIRPEEGVFGIVLDTTDWPVGTHSFLIAAVNRPAPGDYIHDQRTFNITVSDGEVKKMNEKEEGLIFHASFDKGLDADYSKGSPEARHSQGLTITTGNRGKIGEAVLIDGKAYLNYSLKGNFNPKEGTVLMWIKPNWSDPKKGGLFINIGYGGSLFNLAIYRGTGHINFRVWNKGQRADVLSKKSVMERWWKDEWHQVGFSFNAATRELVLILDGAIERKVVAPIDLPVLAEIGLIGVGQRFTHADIQFNGYIDEIRIYDRFYTELPELLKKLGESEKIANPVKVESAKKDFLLAERMRGLLHNEDCTNFFVYPGQGLFSFPAGKAGGMIDHYIDVLAGAGVTALFLNTNAVRTNYRSNVWEAFWDGYDPDGPDDQPFLAGIPEAGIRLRRKLVGNMLAVYEQSVCFPSRVIQRCRYHGISPWISLRMNDAHATLHILDHPLDNFKRKGITGWFANTFDYAHQEVRDHFRALIVETLKRFDIDGLELDFMREPFLFSKGQEEEGREILTQWIREVRGLVDGAAKRRGRAIKLGVRVPSHPEAALGLGLDVPTWAKEELVDLVVVAPRWATMQFAMPLGRWRELLGDRIILAGGVEPAVRPFPGARAMEIRARGRYVYTVQRC